MNLLADNLLLLWTEQTVPALSAACLRQQSAQFLVVSVPGK